MALFDFRPHAERVTSTCNGCTKQVRDLLKARGVDRYYDFSVVGHRKMSNVSNSNYFKYGLIRDTTYREQKQGAPDFIIVASGETLEEVMSKVATGRIDMRTWTERMKEKKSTWYGNRGTVNTSGLR